MVTVTGLINLPSTVAKMKTAFNLILISCLAVCRGQSMRYSTAMPYAGQGAYSSRHIDVFSFTANQAALCKLEKFSAGIFTERRFLLAATGFHSAAVAIPTRLGNIGLAFNYGGFKNFSEHKVGIAYARRLGSQAELGIQFDQYGYRVPGYGNASAITAELGLTLQLTAQLHAGIHVFNPQSARLSGSDERLSAAYKLGFGFDVSESFFTGIEVIKEEDKPVDVLASMQYQFMKKLFARAGFLSASSTAFFGAGVRFSSFRCDLSASFHPQLGISPGLLIIFFASQ